MFRGINAPNADVYIGISQIIFTHTNNISFPLKSDNIIGLQLADFIPNVLARKALGKAQKNFSIYKCTLVNDVTPTFEK